MLGTLALVLIALTHGQLTHGQKSSCGTLSSKDSLESWLIIAFHGVASGLISNIEESFDVMVLNTSHHWCEPRLDRLDRWLQGYKRFQRKFLEFQMRCDSRSEPQQNGRIQTRKSKGPRKSKRTRHRFPDSQIPRASLWRTCKHRKRLGCLFWFPALSSQAS